ncbi:aspartate aminotransferase family protein [Enterovirga aerilata]|uniref:Acetylornithine aminotransferase n=1 Tax=Enterovirga aerilata TaxID=2730920 RepID=A0A849I8N5_9HYPH|nr:aspartate aminotransferase family protein [Enterovirga sp. DB1703]NNM74154.1 aspartate aminotransferase family protein [Enterovirga sp. DB1703]
MSSEVVSQTQAERARAIAAGETFFHPNLIPTHKRLPVAFTHGKGVWLFDEGGRRYLDMLAGIAVDTLGHADPRLVSAVSEQAGRVIHVSNNFHIPVQEQLAERLARLSGMEKAFFANSGAEANEAAIKLARAYGHRNGKVVPQIVVMEKAFHGRTLATLWAGGNTKIQAGFGPPVDGFVRVPFGNVEAIEQALDANPSVAAILLEPIQGEGGLHPLEPAVLDRIARLARSRNVLLMLDEVQTGIARTGKIFAFQHSSIVPDVMTLAKGLGGGLPIGACLVSGPAVDVFGVGSHGSTYGGNPLVCAAANAVLQAVEEDDLASRAVDVGNHVQALLRSRLSVPGVVEIRGRGLMIGIELDRPCSEIVRLSLDAGLLLSVTAERIIRLVPPLTITREEAEQGVDLLVPVILNFLRA